MSPEKYFSLWKDGIKNSSLSEKVKGEVLSRIDFNSYYGLGLLVITIPPQTEISYVDGDVYWREGDETKQAKQASEIAMVARRF